MTHRNTSRQCGFSLMELIAVMAIIAILAGTLAPNVFEAIKRARADAEIENLASIAISIELSVLQNKTIPTSTTNAWVLAVEKNSDFNAKDIEFNSLNFRRRLIFDPHFFTTTNSAFPGLNQNQGLANLPNSPRALLVSDMTANVANIPNTAAEFNSVWDQTVGADLVESSNLKIQRINFSSKFHRVILSNQHANQPFYQLENGTTTAIPAAVGGSDGSIIRFVLQDTKISLFAEPFPTGGKQLIHIVKSDWSIRYQTDGTNWSWEE
ncbi:MAG: type II secretion system GspH family protein [Kangiellaceae bacterium]|nr:type II secretion system GspH family protein [Kangiellaceae bacterium]